MSNIKENRRAINVVLPGDEAQAVIDLADKLNISITLALRMLIREHLMGDPIKFTENE